ncbi:MAG: PhaM family polyhydroxyalkanoate granule multifunctional regulatory protein [Corticimicrobacter sp.]|uniref:PhaM family polyhydroxyalkanoate granule multifunctional regulatory protein n=1 Tax=Corticimicrobacter sp. TaxID=2678536 RepID=UPI0032DA4DA2
MAADSFNPFAIPGGLGSMGSNPLLSGMDMMQQAWGGLAGPQGLASGLPLAAGLDPQELDRRITELKTVQGWLQFNLSMLSNTIQSLEVQRATMAALQGFSDGLLAAARTTGQAAERSEAQATAGKDATADTAGSPKPVSGTTNEAAQAVSAAFGQSSQAWWDTLNTQFTQILDMVRVSDVAVAPAASSAPTPASAPTGKPAGGREKTAVARKATANKKTATSTPAARKPAVRKPAARKPATGKAAADKK